MPLRLPDQVSRWGAGAIKVWPSTPSEPCARRLFFGEDRRVAIRSSVVRCVPSLG